MAKSLDEIFKARYESFFELFIKEFLKESAIVWESTVRKEGDQWVSLHNDVIADPTHFLNKWADDKQEELKDCMLEKFESALIAWALEKMGEDEFRNRIERALADFWRQILVSPRPRPKRSNLIELAEHAILKIPIKTSRATVFPYDRIKEIKETYEEAKRAATEIKTIHGSEPSARRYAIEQQWPDVSPKVRAEYESMAPAQIARDFTARKFSIGAESLKKVLRQIGRYPQDVLERELSLLKQSLT